MQLVLLQRENTRRVRAAMQPGRCARGFKREKTTKTGRRNKQGEGKKGRGEGKNRGKGGFHFTADEQTKASRGLFVSDSAARAVLTTSEITGKRGRTDGQSDGLPGNY